MAVILEDGREVVVSISRFPSTEALTSEQRQQWQSIGESFTFEECDEVFHIEQVLGSYSTYRHK